MHIVAIGSLSSLHKSMIEEASVVTKYSRSKHSKISVGAALLMENGEIVCGTNFESDSYGLSVCAERVAIFNANSSGILRESSPCALAIAFDFGGKKENHRHARLTPCGACLQVLSEVIPDKRCFFVYTFCAGERHACWFTFSEFLPVPFSLGLSD